MMRIKLRPEPTVGIKFVGLTPNKTAQGSEHVPHDQSTPSDAIDVRNLETRKSYMLEGGGSNRYFISSNLDDTNIGAVGVEMTYSYHSPGGDKEDANVTVKFVDNQGNAAKTRGTADTYTLGYIKGNDESVEKKIYLLPDGTQTYKPSDVVTNLLGDVTDPNVSSMFEKVTVDGKDVYKIKNQNDVLSDIKDNFSYIMTQVEVDGKTYEIPLANQQADGVPDFVQLTYKDPKTNKTTTFNLPVEQFQAYMDVSDTNNIAKEFHNDMEEYNAAMKNNKSTANTLVSGIRNFLDSVMPNKQGN